MTQYLVLFLILPLLVMCSTMKTNLSGTSEWDSLVDRYFNDYFEFYPTAGTAAGLHQYDGKLENLSPLRQAARVAELNHYLSEFQSADTSSMDANTRVDKQIVLDSIRAELLEFQNIHSWEKNPDRYSGQITQAVFGIMSRDFAAPQVRLSSVIERERQIPDFLIQARHNLDNPPRIYTEVALEQLPDIIHFFKKDVPEAFKKVTDKDLLARFRSSNEAVIKALGDYEHYLRQWQLPRSTGDFRLGAENYAKKLLYEESVDVPLDQLLKIGYDNLKKDQEAYAKIAHELNPKRTPAEILHSLNKNHPPAKRLLASFRGQLDGLRQFIIDHHIVAIPSPVMPTVMETPPFMRALTSASMDTPGAYEDKATGAFFNVTLPEKGWSSRKTEEYLEGFDRGTIVSTSIHEAFPGHYVQFLWVKQAPSKVRKLLGANTNVEGWAHYCEQMMLDEGYGNNDPKLRLGQLQDALLRDARYIVGIKMHTGQMTMEDGIKFFVHEGYQSQATAERETKRGTSDPTYLYYTLGKLEFLKLRADYLRQKGGTLEQFHNAALAEGYPALRYLRQLLLGENSGAVL